MIRTRSRLCLTLRRCALNRQACISRGRDLPCAHCPRRPTTSGPRPPINALDAHRAPPQTGRPRPCQPVVSVLVSFTPVHGGSRASVAACTGWSGRWRTGVNGGAQYSKACEGASLPWVQIPPPPPLTCDDASPLCLLGGGGHPSGLSFGLPLSGAVHRRPRPLVRAGHGRWRTVVNAGAQYSKACEGASLPWVQIPPPPPLTCNDASLLCLLRGGRHRRWAQFWATNGLS